ncbi:MAG: hypothetical protein Q3992_05640 [Bacteroides sp.]|nr:hypothetical protein [Bacteroides sp.]
MAHKLNTNKQFMIGNGLLAFAVLVIVVIFIYISFRFRDGAKPEQRFTEIYAIQIDEKFIGDSLSVMINDSTIFNNKVSKDNAEILLNRFEENSALLVVNKKDNLLFTFELSPKGGRYKIMKKENSIELE